MIGPSYSLIGSYSKIWTIPGSKYANVLPDPVSAIPITSLPAIITGRTMMFMQIEYLGTELQ